MIQGLCGQRCFKEPQSIVRETIWVLKELSQKGSLESYGKHVVPLIKYNLVGDGSLWNHVAL